MPIRLSLKLSLVTRPAGDLVCLIELTGRDGTFMTQPIPFRRSGSSWTLLNPDEPGLSPVCPGKEEAQRALRALKKLDSLVVTEVPDEGTFSDERGHFEKVKGPWRLVCTYSVDTKPAGEQTWVTYITREGGKYFAAPEWGLDAIVTRNRRDYKASKIAVVSAEECLELAGL